MALSQFVDGQNVSANGEQLQADQEGLPVCVSVFCQTALTVIFSVLWKFIIYREIMKQRFNYEYMQLACYFCHEIQFSTCTICRQFLHLHPAYAFVHFFGYINKCGTRCWWRSWLRHCATSQKVTGSISDDVTGIFH